MGISSHIIFRLANVYVVVFRETYQMMTEFQIPTPKTVKYDTELKIEDQPYPFFLKVASGTNAGRGVWHCTNTKELEEALQTKEVKYRGDDNLLLVQTPTYGDIVCAEVIYNHGKPLGFFFAQSVNVSFHSLRLFLLLKSYDDVEFFFVCVFV